MRADYVETGKRAEPFSFCRWCIRIRALLLCASIELEFRLGGRFTAIYMREGYAGINIYIACDERPNLWNAIAMLWENIVDAFFDALSSFVSRQQLRAGKGENQRAKPLSRASKYLPSEWISFLARQLFRRRVRDMDGDINFSAYLGQRVSRVPLSLALFVRACSSMLLQCTRVRIDSYAPGQYCARENRSCGQSRQVAAAPPQDRAEIELLPPFFFFFFPSNTTSPHFVSRDSARILVSIIYSGKWTRYPAVSFILYFPTVSPIVFEVSLRCCQVKSSLKCLP